MRREALPARQTVNVESLPPERKARVAELESTTDRVYALRSQLADFFRTYRNVLPKPDKGEIAHAPLQQALKKIMDRVDGGETLEHILGFSGTDEILDQDADTAVEELDRLVAFEEALTAFRELRDLSGSDLSTGGAEEKDVSRFYKMRWQELGSAMREREEMLAEARRLEDMREKVLASHAHPKVLERIDTALKELQDRSDEFFTTHPEAWVYAKALRLKDMKQTFDKRGRIVETPYVKLKMQQIIEEAELGRPVFVIGELGSGKTELARHTAYTHLSKPHVERWETEHPEPPKDDTEAHDTWLAAREKEREAIVISGHRNLETEALLASRSVQKKEAPGPEIQIDTIRKAWGEYKKKLTDQGADEKDLEIGGPTYRALEAAYLESFRAPIETPTVLGAVLQGMKEGRPVILDEMNAVPHHVLIVLNDLLMRKPGDLIHVPIAGAEPFRVQEGFCFMGTGNYKPEDGKRYVGRQSMDAAFLSRFGVVSYDYLPMSETGGSQDKPEENELFHMVVARFMEQNLTIEIPEGSLEQLKKLCRVARQLQNIVSDKGFSQGYYATINGARVDPREVLKENVLSIRHLLPIVDEWKRGGFRRNLNDLLFDKYVSKSNERPAEKQFIYWALQVQGGFFPTSQDPNAPGWPDSLTGSQDVLTYTKAEERLRRAHTYTSTPVRTKETLQLHRYSTKELVEELFGKTPVRTELPAAFVEEKSEGASRLTETTLLALERLLGRNDAAAGAAVAAGIDLSALLAEVEEIASTIEVDLSD